VASTPSFAATPQAGSGLIPGTADTSLTAPTNVTTILSGGASGTRIEEIIFQGVGTTVAGVINVFLYDGSTYHLVEQVVVTAVTSSTTAAAFRTTRTFDNLIVKNGWSLRVTGTVAGNVSLVKVTAFGGDF
jgi:hypothetical protein